MVENFGGRMQRGASDRFDKTGATGKDRDRHRKEERTDADATVLAKSRKKKNAIQKKGI